MAAPPLPRDSFDLLPGLLWAAHCADGPLPRRAAAAGAAALATKGRPWELDWKRDLEGIPAELKRQAARLLGLPAEDLSLTTNTSTGLAMLARSVAWRPGDQVVVPRGEFPSNYWPWKALEARGVTLREVPLWSGHGAGKEAWSSPPPTPEAEPERRLLESLGASTRILAVSWVRFQDGLRLDLPTLGAQCRAAEVDLVVDGIQGAGTLPLDLDCAAAFVTGGHKGLLGPHGQGLVWTDPDFRRQLAPPGGWLSVEEAGHFSRPGTDFDRDWAADAARLDSGLPNLAGCAALGASLRLLNSVGAATIAGHVRRLQERLLTAFLDHPKLEVESARLRGLLEADRLGSILALHHRGRGVQRLIEVAAEGHRSGIYTTVREGYLRIALHGWHDEEDVDRLAAWLGSAW